MFFSLVSRLQKLIAALAMTATVGVAQQDDLPERFFLLSQLYYAPGVGPMSSLPIDLGGGPPPVPEEVTALGLTSGAPDGQYFSSIIWPWIVFDEGRPVALLINRSVPEGETFPERQKIVSIEGATDTFWIKPEDVRELSYERSGETISFRARFFTHNQYIDGPYDNKKETPERLYGIFGRDGEIAPADGPGCFRLESYWSREFYNVRTSAFDSRYYDEVPYGKATICLKRVETGALPDGRETYLMEARFNGVVGRNKAEARKLEKIAYMVAVSAPINVMTGDYVLVSGKLDFSTESLVENINRFSASLEETLERGDFDLAARQVDSLNAYLGDLEARNVDWQWIRRPTAASVVRYNELLEATEIYLLAHLETQARVNDVRQQLMVLRSNFSGNIVKSMLKSTINWMNVVPTDPISGLAGYSDIVGVLLLPQSLQDWKETAETDSSILANQVAAIRHFEALEVALAKRLEDITEAHRALFERIEENQEQRVLDLDAALRRD